MTGVAIMITISTICFFRGSIFGRFRSDDDFFFVMIDIVFLFGHFNIHGDVLVNRYFMNNWSFHSYTLECRNSMFGGNISLLGSSIVFRLSSSQRSFKISVTIFLNSNKYVFLSVNWSNSCSVMKSTSWHVNDSSSNSLL